MKRIKNYARIKKITKEFKKLRYIFSKLKIKEIRKRFYEIESKISLSTPKIKEIERNFFELEKISLNSKSIMIMMTSNTKE